MLKSKYADEIAFVMGNLLNASNDQLQKNAQLLTPESEREAGSEPVGLGRTLSQSVEENIDTGNPTDIASRYEDYSGKDFGAVSGGHKSLLEQQEEIEGELGEGKQLAYEQFMKGKTEHPEYTETAEPSEAVDLPVRDFPEDVSSVEIDWENPFKSPSDFSPSGAGKPTDQGTVEEGVDWGELPSDLESEWRSGRTASVMLTKLQKIATHFGDKGDVRNEMLTDRLLNSVINYMTKK